MRRPVRVSLLAAVASVLGLAATVAPAASATAPPAGAAPARSAAVSPTVVVLPTGDRVLLGTAGGRPHVSVLPQSGIRGYRAEVAGSDTYVIPTIARPFLGSLLDRSLFDVTALSRESSPGTVALTVSTNSAAAAVPGMTVTSHTASTQTGYLTSSGMARFRAALTTAFESVAQPGARMPTSFFGGVTRIARAGAVAPAVVPDFQQVTLIVKVIDSAGRPAAGGEITLSNVDNAAKFTVFSEYENGQARFSVPLGHYSGLIDQLTFNRTTGALVDRFVPLGQVTVSTDDQHVVFDVRRATSRVTVQTPKPAATQNFQVEFDRQDAHGGGFGSSFGYGPDSTVYVAPTPAPTVGSMDWLATWSMAATPSTGAPYTYDLTFNDPYGIVPDQSHTVAAFQLATINASYYADLVQRTALFGRSPLYPFQFGSFGELDPMAIPVRRTEYVYADPTVVWFAGLAANSTDENPFGDMVNDDLRSYPAGSSTSVDWLRGPLAPGIPAQTAADTFYFCNACRTAGQLSVFLAPFLDTTPGHLGEVSRSVDGRSTSGFALYRNGVRIASGANIGGGQFPVPAGTSTYRIHLRVDRSGDDAFTSTSTVTDLGFVSSAADGAHLPSGWECGIDPSTGCSVLPLLSATVPLPTDLSDHLPLGPSSFTLTIAPIQGALPTTITSAHLAISLNGSTYRQAALTPLGNGRYRVELDNPPGWAGRTVTVRVSATAANGSTITQTTDAAYAVADS